MLLRRTIGDWFDKNEVDLVLLPTMRRSPRTVDDTIKEDGEREAHESGIGQYGGVQHSGHSRDHHPCGFNAKGVPVGLMIAGRPWAEGQVLALAHNYQRTTDWHTRRPPLTPETPVPALKAESEDKPKA